MIPSETEARIKAQVWQAIAEGKLDVSELDDATRTELVDVVTLAALDAVDKELGIFLAENEGSLESVGGRAAEPLEADEELLWEGRPFLSVTVHYMITNQRIRIARGFLGRTFQNVELIRVQDIDHRQSLGERMINRGDIEIRSHDPNSPIVVLENVGSPEDVYEILRRAVRQARQDQGLSFQEEM